MRSNRIDEALYGRKYAAFTNRVSGSQCSPGSINSDLLDEASKIGEIHNQGEEFVYNYISTQSKNICTKNQLISAAIEGCKMFARTIPKYDNPAFLYGLSLIELRPNSADWSSDLPYFSATFKEVFKQILDSSGAEVLSLKSTQIRQLTSMEQLSLKMAESISIASQDYWSRNGEKWVTMLNGVGGDDFPKPDSPITTALIDWRGVRKMDISCGIGAGIAGGLAGTVAPGVGTLAGAFGGAVGGAIGGSVTEMLNQWL